MPTTRRVFFFSSRRRHTRSLCDWSSDVCSSDLMNETAIMLRHFVTSSVLELMEKGMLADVPKLKSPVDDVWHNVEIRDPGKWKVHLEDGSVVSPIDIQRYYLGKIEGIHVGDADKRAFRLVEEILD